MYKQKAKTKKRKILKGSRGITLIALVITIIVLLILAGVTIITLTGDNGLLSQSERTAEENSKAEAEEQVKLAVMGSYGDNGKLDYKELKDNLNKITGIEEITEEITKDSFPLTVKVNGYEVTINANGNAVAKNENIVGWYKTGDGTITNGKDNVKIGDYVAYNSSSEGEQEYTSPGGTYAPNDRTAPPNVIEKGTGKSYGQCCQTSSYLGGWRVLGVNESTRRVDVNIIRCRL